ncbi:MAG: hypothetical protein M1833_003004, partial [Piccolia ochrophora]
MDDPGGTNTNGGDASIETLLARLQRQSSRQGVNGNASQAQASAVAQLTDQLHSQSSSTSQSRAPSQSYFPFSTPTQASRPQHASVSSPIVSPPPGGPEPHHPSAVMSPNVGTPNTASSAPGGGQTGGDRTSTLLNLLKFSQPSSSPRSTPAPRQAQQEAGSGAANSGYGAGKVEQTQAAQNAHGRGISASDLVASLMGKNAAPASRDPSSQPTQRINQPELTRETGDGASSPTADTQDLLLKLLNRPKPQQSGASAARRASGQASSPDRTSPEAVIDDLSQDFADASLEKVPSGPSDPRKSQRANQQATATPERKENTKQETTRGMFTYVNPFEQLAASSPRNRTPKAGTPRSGTPRSGNVTPIFEILKPSRGAAVDPEGTIDHGQKSKEHSPTPTQPSSMKRAFAGGDHVQQAMSSPPPAPLPDGRSQLEALIGIGASKKPNAESVSHALNEIGGKIGQEVEGALAKADKEWSENDETRTSEAVERIAVDELEDEIQEAAAEMKEELDKPENQGVLEETMPEPVAEAVKDVIDTAARENIADTWESGDTEEGLREAEDTRIIKVLNFPLRPFVSITLRPLTDALPSFRQDYVMDIARLKKEFDQVDRTLATASKDYIVYSITKHGGLRVIRQDDGQDKQIFTQTKDRIFNVAASTAARGSASHGTESVIGTGVSGSVYWVNLARPDKDLWDVENSESNGFVLPPIPSPDEGTSGGLLKTRARSSSRHPEFFAVGRGKSIHIIWPNVAQTPRYLRNQKDRTVDTVKYLEERSLKVTTGKAGKDFAFSEDDTTIASLDKLGRLRFWDIRALVNASHGALDVTAPKVSVEIATPLMTFSTTQPAEKAWPSSVHFVDKIRPFTRGTAVRYLIVGMKQNHTLQLWDLALGKPVQELRFPHGNESDAICSILFHAPSGIIVVGHPTRNSIFFVHLSAPRYNMTSMTQARYLERLAQGDPLLPKPEATAIMSGVREISFASKGKLRSLDILQQPNSVAEGADSPVLFELYAMHSKGVSCLTVKREDFGWGSDNRVLHPVDAEREGAVTIEEL